MSEVTARRMATKTDIERLGSRAVLYKLAIGIVVEKVGLSAG